jgi:hypothetical protein
LLSTQPVTPVYPNKSGTTFTHGVTVVVPVMLEVLVAEVDVPEALVELSVIVTVDDFTQ